ncbi:protein of unknown function DUF2431 [Macleaya cordata]|uniref:25S rRNA (uridine-N(3))-methyltransferase BMT5-like domain-containing protein n=1 Tax=Macleaya cordata TaxID=56857 RepID=A0A200QCH1_MACCD|nr:protein of unknown function DUF2431 [Macleaya cordata]
MVPGSDVAGGTHHHSPPKSGLRGFLTDVIRLHQKVVRGFLQSARDMLAEDGEVHVTHKTTFPFSLWKVDKLGEEVGLQIVEEALFSKLDYPGYANKKGDGPQSDLSFPVGCSSTFKFSLLKKQMRDFSATAHDPENKNFEDYGPKTESTHHSTVCMEWWKTFALPGKTYSLSLID